MEVTHALTDIDYDGYRKALKLHQLHDGNVTPLPQTIIVSTSPSEPINFVHFLCIGFSLLALVVNCTATSW